MLYLALSCLQGREMQSAAAELWTLQADGLQLTPGNVPTPGFKEWLQAQQIPITLHHSFHWHTLRRKVWDPTATCLTQPHSVHPPHAANGITELWKHKAEQGDYAGILMETMIPPYALGDGEALTWAMDIGLPLAVDVSHIYIQLCQSCLDLTVWHRLQDYENIGELHLSANSGELDTHQPLTAQTFGLDWVQERSQDGIPVVLECYMHRLSESERNGQVALISR